MNRSRRAVLRGLGVAVALPWLEVLARPASAASPPRRRLLAVCNNMGLLADRFFPKGTIAGDLSSPYLDLLAAHREHFTVVSGTSHPRVDGGHSSDICFLTAAVNPTSAAFRNTVSLDQHAAAVIGQATRFPSLTLGVNVQSGVRSLSWTRTGAMIPCRDRPSEVFRQLYLQGSAAEVKAQLRELERGRSILDAVGEQARAVGRSMGRRDRDRLDQYFTGVRDLERDLSTARAWATRPKPVPTVPPPVDAVDPGLYMERARLMYDMARLAFESDSTRLVTLMLDGLSGNIRLEGREMNLDYHDLTHHGNAPVKLRELERIELGHMKLLDRLLADLRASAEGDATLLDRTVVLYGSNLGSGNSHGTTNLPILVAGGGFKHGRHLAFDRERNASLPKLFVSVLRQLGIPTDRFAGGEGPLPGLESKPG